MTTLKKMFPVLLVTILFLFPTFQNVQAKDNNIEMKNWLEDTANPSINKIVKDFNDTTEENWYVNLSSHLIESDKKSTVTKLTVLREDISDLKKEVKEIKPPKSAKKKDKKQIKEIKKSLTKSLNQADASAKKLTKRAEKDKKITTVKAPMREQKNMSKANTAYVALNDTYTVDTPPLKLVEAVIIDPEVAKVIIQVHEEKIKKIAARKAEEKKKKEAIAAAEAEKKALKEAEEKKMAEEKAAAAEAKRLEEEARKAEEIAKIERQKVEEEQARVKQQEEEEKKEAIATSNESEWFQNCTELRKKYPNGVASDHPAYEPKMDRDKDNWACEK